MKRIYFGTDGVRGPYGGPVINENFAARLGVAAARVLAPRGGRVLIGRDTRGSGESLLRAIATGLAKGGAQPVSLDVVPTPAVAAAVLHEKAAFGVMITASHNPASDNGIKFFGANGMKLNDAEEFAIEQALPAEEAATTTTSLQTLRGLDVYLEKVRRLLPARALAGWKIVLDAANGATCGTSPLILRELGADVELIGGSPDGTNINAGVGSEHPEKLAARVRETSARIGIAHDGDGDRCILCDEQGGVLDGDEILTILALQALERRSLVADTLVVTVQSNLGVDSAVQAAGGRVVRTAVGDRYVLEGMLREGATLGGESSGHVICSEISPTGDGLVAALKVIEVMLATGRPLSELRCVLKKFPQGSLNLKVREKRDLASLPSFPATIAALEKELGTQGRVLVRYSGTEAKLRLLVEGATAAIVHNGLGRLEAAARQDLDVL